MKKIITLVVLVYSLWSYSQIPDKTYKQVKLIEPQSFYLCGGTKNMMGGTSRTGFKVDLPPNTVEWYYSFTTEPNKNKIQHINLDDQLGFLLKTMGFSNDLLKLIKIPVGEGLIDVYLTNRNGYDSFFKKNGFGAWVYKAPNHFIEGSGQNMRQGKIKIDDVKSGSHFLVVRNTSGTTGINIMLEVVAIVEETTFDMSKWSKEYKEQLFHTIRKEVSIIYAYYSEDRLDEIAGCMMAKILAQKKPSDLSELAEYELKMFYKKQYSECVKPN